MLDESSLAAAEARLGYAFRDRRLLAEALTHSSGKTDALPSNERLEFLGDSILGAIVARQLFLAQPDWDEGDLTRVKSAVVSAATLAEASLALGLPEFFVIGKGLAKEGRFPTSLLANVFEAVVAAIYLDGGFEAAERFVMASLGDVIDRVIHEGLARNWKSILQQYAQKTFSVTPTYRVTREEGPDHVKRFEVVACVGDRELGRGEGRSKKEAEQRAAEATLRALLGDAAEAVPQRAAAAPAPASAPTDEAHATPLPESPILADPPPRPLPDEPPEDEPAGGG